MIRQPLKIKKDIKRVVIWFSCGVTSAVAAKLTIKKYQNKYPIVIAFCDTGSEHDDNFRFLFDCETYLGSQIEILKNPKYKNTIDVYEKTKYLVGVAGARCTLELKKKVRQKFENVDTDLQIFGYDISERNRAKRFIKNNPLVQVEFPLIDKQILKSDCFQMLIQANIKRPLTYDLGFNNANCLKAGCPKGGAGYWNHYKKHFPKEFDRMAEIERKLNVAILKKHENNERIRIFLDELPKTMGNYNTEPSFQCGLFCEQI